MTSTLLQDFNERSKEVSKYFIFLKNMEQGTIKLSMEGIEGKTKVRNIDSELEKTLKASGFLVLYNLIESTMRNAIETIFDELSSQGVSFNDMKPCLKKVIISNLKNLKVDDGIVSQITNISIHIVNAGFNKEKLFSGNIDSRLIKEKAKEYGFSCTTNSSKTGNGSDLRTIKENRIDLAHGIKSFAEVGKDKSADELLKIKIK